MATFLSSGLGTRGFPPSPRAVGDLSLSLSLFFHTDKGRGAPLPLSLSLYKDTGRSSPAPCARTRTRSSRVSLPPLWVVSTEGSAIQGNSVNTPPTESSAQHIIKAGRPLCSSSFGLQP